MARLLASTTAHSRSSLSVTAACAYICALNAPRIANRLTARASSTMNPTNGHSTNPAAAHTARRKKKNGQAEADGDSSTARTVPTTEDTIAAMSSLSLNARSVQLNERDQRPNAVNAIRAPRNDNQRLNTTTSTKAPSSQSLQQKAYQRRPIATSSSKASSSQSLWRDDYQRPTTNSSSKASTSQAYLDKTTSALIPLTSQCRTISASTKPSRILLVFDLNGTLLDRLSFKHEDRHAFRENPYAPRMADFTEQKRKIFVRPFFDHFLAELEKMDSFELAVWTSAQSNTTLPVVHKLFGAQCLTGGRLRFAWFRDRCTIPNPAQWKDCIKDLSKVWAHLSQGGTPTAAPHNTLLIDDTDGKARLQPRNHLPIPPFDICDPNTQAVNDSTLLRLLDYLRDMHASKVAIDTIDVRDYLAARPFHLQPEVTVLPRDVRPNMRREK